MKIERDEMSRMFIVFNPSRSPIYWTTARKASISVSTIAFKYGRTWADLVADGYELRKIFYVHTQATYKTFHRGIGPTAKYQMQADE